MKIAILGGGITGLTAAHDLAKKNHEVVLFEKEKVLGGLASGFWQKGWEWPLERAYHHLFANDWDIRNFTTEIGFNRVKLGSRKIFFKDPETASLYKKSKITLRQSQGDAEQSRSITNKNYEIYPFDTPFDLLRFPLLNPLQKIRAGAVLAGLKLSPFLSLYENQTAEEFLRRTMGDGVWNILWRELFRKKFGKYAENIVASFIWARLKKRSKKLGYIEGGFQTFIDFLEEKNRELGVDIRSGVEVEDIKETPKSRGFVVNGERFDAVISTLPTPALCKIAADVLPREYLERLSKLKYLHAVNLILESKERFLDTVYWLNVVTDKLPFVVLVQQTNFVDKKHYGANHILYVGNYVERDDKLLKMDADEVLNYFLPYLKKINPKFQILDSKFYLFNGPFAQPIFNRTFIKNKPDFITPVKNFYIANLDMTYPYDRGTNYAVKLGREIAEIISSSNP